ncbi:hypoxanthine phosphoribosyltransferase [Chloroflexota bacterium]
MALGDTLATGRQRIYYRAVRRATSLINSNVALEQVLPAIVRAVSRVMEGGASLLLLDSSKKKLVHNSSWKLPKSYLQKGVLDAKKSLSEVVTGQPVPVADVSKDDCIQYPALAAEAGIASILGVPIVIGGAAVGTIRAYVKERTEFSQQDIDFLMTMANLSAIAIDRNIISRKVKEGTTIDGQTEVAVVQQTKTVAFAHLSEQEFTRILDFYNIEWIYEPRSFPLEQEDDRVIEMFTPDFYLPGLDLYVELTTLKQAHVTEKNRKLRRLRKLNREIKITLLYRKDFDRLLAKYGYGPLAQARGHGVSRVLFSDAEIEKRVQELATQISKDYADRNPIMVGVLRGVFCFMADLIRHMAIPVDVEFMAISYYGGGNNSTVKITKDVDLNVAGRHVIMVEDIVDTGMTLNYVLKHLRAKGPASLAVCTLLDKRVRRIVDVPLGYTGFEVPDLFVVGYGLDYREEYRNLPFIGVLGEEQTDHKKDTFDS